MALPLRAVKPCHVPHLIIRTTKSFSFCENSFRCQNQRQISTMDSRVRFQGNQNVSSNEPGVNSQQSPQLWKRSDTNTYLSQPVPLAKEIFFQGLKRVIPSRLITTKIQLQGSLLRLEDNDKTTIDLSQYNKKYVIGFGKACLPMAESLLELLNGLVDRCIVSVPVGSRMCKNNSVEVYRGAKDNIPDDESFAASQKIVELVRSCTSNDLLIVLISGGGSALLPFPVPPVTLEEKKLLIKTLSKAGCTINEMNTVRKRLSMVKGGGLVQMCNAGKIVSLIISDVLGSPLDIIASGPTVKNLDPPDAAWNVIMKYNVDDVVTKNLSTVLKREPNNACQRRFDKVTNFIIGDNQIALEAAANAATKCGLHPFIITSEMSGEAAEIGYDLATLAEAFALCIRQTPQDIPTVRPNVETILRIFKQNKWSTEGVIPDIFEEHAKASKGICLLFGGETTVKVRGNGMGGRNQEMALSAGIRLDISRNLPHVKNKVSILCAGTDGFDGPNDAAGAVVEGPTINNAQLLGFSPLEYLRDNNSFNFFKCVAEGKYHIICGHTETNVMDIALIVILKKEGEKNPERRKSLL